MNIIVVIVEVFDKKARATPPQVIENSKRRLREYDSVVRSHERASERKSAK